MRIFSFPLISVIVFDDADFISQIHKAESAEAKEGQRY